MHFLFLKSTYNTNKMTTRHSISHKKDRNNQVLIFISEERGDQESYIMQNGLPSSERN